MYMQCLKHVGPQQTLAIDRREGGKARTIVPILQMRKQRLRDEKCPLSITARRYQKQGRD